MHMHKSRPSTFKRSRPLPGMPLTDISNSLQSFATDKSKGAPAKHKPLIKPPASTKQEKGPLALVPSPDTSARVALRFMRASAARNAPDSDDESVQLQADLFEAEIRSMKLKEEVSNVASQAKEAESARVAAEKRVHSLQVELGEHRRLLGRVAGEGEGQAR